MGAEGILTLSWLIRLRWAALTVYAGLLALGSWGLGLELPIGLCGSLLAMLATTNLGLQAWWDAEGPGPRVLTGSVLILDILVFGGLLGATGGPSNPCSSLFLVHVALAAAALGPRWGWGMAVLASAVYAILFPFHEPLGHLGHQMEGMAWHLWGMWAGFAATSGLVAHFVGRLSEALGDARTEAQRLQARADREARLASVTALAAGAAHELATPLGTIALAAADLDPRDPEGWAEDVALIRTEVDRCRSILDTLAYEGGQLTGETPRLVDLRLWGESVARELDPGIRWELEPLQALLPARALGMVVRALVRNACDAASPVRDIRVGIRSTQGGLRISVSDAGAGFPPEILTRIGEPFTTTKGEAGLGLGLFLARGFAERLGGRLEVDGSPGRTEVALLLPGEVLR